MNDAAIQSAADNDIEALSLLAFEAVAPMWPLETFIAVNHLGGFDRYPFELVMSRLAPLYGARGYLNRSSFDKLRRQGRITEKDEKEAARRLDKSRELKTTALPCVMNSLSEQSTPGTEAAIEEKIKLLNEHTIKWCAPFFDKGNAIWEMPHKENGLYQAWKKLAYHDLSLPQSARNAIRQLPETSAQALKNYLQEIKLTDKEEIVGYLMRMLMLLPGWSSYVRNHEGEAISGNARLDFLAIRSVLDYEFNRDYVEQLRSAGAEKFVEAIEIRNEHHEKQELRSEQASNETEIPILQEALEINYRNQLISSLKQNSAITSNPGRKDAQMAFCIDARSEGMRRHIEKLGNYQTIGFAGFFGFPISFECGQGEARALCPVLIKPQATVRAAVPTGLESKNARITDRLKSSFREVLYTLRSNFLAKFYFAEAAGIWLTPVIFCKSFLPRHWRIISDQLGQTVKTPTLTIEADPSSLSLATRVSMARGALKGMGLTENFSPLVVLCGHAATSANNAYAYSLDCGACGGNGGSINARTAAAVLNQADVRAELAGCDIIIPADTYFIAAEHNTTLDEVSFFNTGFLPGQHQKFLSDLKADLKKAGAQLREERSRSLSESAPFDAASRSVDWSQTRPEWGLARNAAFIAAGRRLTSGVDLQRRTFLHDYDPNKDPDCSILELIMTAPLIVAHWINMQYYLSTVDNRVFGSGSKTTQNIVGNLGVIQGAAGDLKLGLPLESVALSENNIYHEPMRLLVLIESNRQNLDEVMDKHENVKRLVDNRWIRLMAVENGQYYEKTESGWSLVNIESTKRSQDMLATSGAH